jgi:3-mercaptopyruvate sulfurtransferase SseA
MHVKWGVTMVLLLILGTGLVQAAQMSPPAEDIPIELIRVKQVAQLLSDGAMVALVDVRSRQEYLIRHIKGALSIPIDSIDARSRDIPRQGIVVLY